MSKQSRTLPATTYKRLGPRLWELRAAKVAKVREVAHELGCSASMVSAVERGVVLPSIRLLTRWASALEAAAELPTLLALHQEDARAAHQAGARVGARVTISRSA